MPAAYPTEAEVSAKITELGGTVPSDLAGIVLGVIEDFERLTGFVPFLSGGSGTWDFDPPYLAKDLTLDLAGAFTTITSVSIGESELSATAYDKLKLNAADESQGWTSIRFRNHPGTTPASIHIVGVRGLYTVLPYGVYQAILDEAAGRAMNRTASSQSDVQMVKMGQMTVNYGQADSMGRTGFAKSAASQFEKTIRQYARLVI